MGAPNCDVRIKYYTESNGTQRLVIKFYDGIEKLFDSEYVALMPKGHRLYMKGAEFGKGNKITDASSMSICAREVAQELRKFLRRKNLRSVLKNLRSTLKNLRR